MARSPHCGMGSGRTTARVTGQVQGMGTGKPAVLHTHGSAKESNQSGSSPVGWVMQPSKGRAPAG